MNKLSAVVSVYNEEKNIEKCLESLSFADEIIVVDNSSTDKTNTLAKKYTKKVFIQKNDPTKIDLQKNFGFAKAENDWILSVDADEEISEELRLEIKDVIIQKETNTGYFIPRKNIIFAKWIKHTGWYPDYQLRLFKKGTGKFTSEHVHEKLSLEGKTGYLTEHIIHNHYQSIQQFLYKMGTLYASNEAETMIKKGYQFAWQDAIRFPMKEFVSRFFAREGYKDGMHGLMLSLLMSFYHFTIFAYLWENKKFSDVTETAFLSEVKNELNIQQKTLKYWFGHEQIKNTSNPLHASLIKIKEKLTP